MKTIKFAALAAALVLQSLAFAANAPSHASAAVKSGSVSVHVDRTASARAEGRRDYFLIPDAADFYGEDCDPEDDCPRPASPQLNTN